MIHQSEKQDSLERLKNCLEYLKVRPQYSEEERKKLDKLFEDH